MVVAFDAPAQSSDGGLPLLVALDRRLGLTASLSQSLVDSRRMASVAHDLHDRVRQRVFSIAMGYADGNNSARIGDDPPFKLACGRSPVSTIGLASQPTLLRFEHSQAGREVVAMNRALQDAVVDRLARRHRRARLITIDLDGSEDPTHGQQPFSFFNGHFDSWCYVPLFGFLSIDDLPEQHGFFARLRPGKGTEGRCVRALLRRFVPVLRNRFSKARIAVRLDAGLATSEPFDLLDELRVEYVVGMPSNSRLTQEAEGDMQMARILQARCRESKAIFGECRFAAKRWTRERRVIFGDERRSPRARSEPAKHAVGSRGSASSAATPSTHGEKGPFGLSSSPSGLLEVPITTRNGLRSLRHAVFGTQRRFMLDPRE